MALYSSCSLYVAGPLVHIHILRQGFTAVWLYNRYDTAGPGVGLRFSMVEADTLSLHIYRDMGSFTSLTA